MRNEIRCQMCGEIIPDPEHYSYSLIFNGPVLKLDRHVTLCRECAGLLEVSFEEINYQLDEMEGRIMSDVAETE